MKISIDELRRYNSTLFWNLLYYFSEFELPYDFMLPYYQPPFKELYIQMAYEEGFKKEAMEKEGISVEQVDELSD